jgi:hypothetical protein
MFEVSARFKIFTPAHLQMIHIKRCALAATPGSISPPVWQQWLFKAAASSTNYKSYNALVLFCGV